MKNRLESHRKARSTNPLLGFIYIWLQINFFEQFRLVQLPGLAPPIDTKHNVKSLEPLLTYIFHADTIGLNRQAPGGHRVDDKSEGLRVAAEQALSPEVVE